VEAGLTSVDAAARDDRPSAVSLALALVAGCGVSLAGLAGEKALPTVAWAALFSSLAVERDVCGHRIPNWLNGAALLGALGVGVALDGLAGFAQAATGAALGLLFYLPLYALRAMGAGDVKAMVALGAIAGPFDVAGVAARALLVGALLGVAWLAWRRELAAFAARWLTILAASVSTRRVAYLAPPADSAANTAIPFALALALGLAWQWLV
jgi:prepilin peptidase CpaA